MPDKKQQSIIAGHAILKIENILRRCDLDDVLVTVDLNGEQKKYIALEELKKAIRMLHKGE